MGKHLKPGQRFHIAGRTKHGKRRRVIGRLSEKAAELLAAILREIVPDVAIRVGRDAKKRK
jgi:hypothetical protein